MDDLGRQCRELKLALAIAPQPGTALAATGQVAGVLDAADPALVGLALALAEPAAREADPLALAARFDGQVRQVYTSDAPAPSPAELDRLFARLREVGFAGWFVVACESALAGETPAPG